MARMTAHRPTLVEAQAAVRAFLRKPCRTSTASTSPGSCASSPTKAAWEADAAVWQPNATIQALGLSTERPVLDQNFYVVRLDGS